MHDSVGHSISLLKIEVQNLELNREAENNYGQITNILKTIDELAEEVRELSHQLRPRILGEFGLVPALKSLVDKTNLQGKIKGYVYQNEEFTIFNDKLEQNIYRICQEALNNIIKHSECTEFNIDLTLRNGRLDIIITDDGLGINLEEHFGNERTSLGLLNMKERAESVGGSFKIDSIIDMGTTIYLTFQIVGALDDQGITIG